MEDNINNEGTEQVSETPQQENQVENQNKAIHNETCCTPIDKCVKFYRALNIITFIAVVVLFILYFTGGGKAKIATNDNTNTGNTYTIAFINSDSLMNHYKLFDEYKTKLENRKAQMENEIATKAKKFEADVNDFQKKVQSYSISSDQAQKLEADLMKRQQQLVELKDNMTEELLEMEMSNQTDLFEKIIDALKLYNKDYNYDYILGYSQGSGILYANEKYDITPAIVEILNNDYDNKK